MRRARARAARVHAEAVGSSRCHRVAVAVTVTVTVAVTVARDRVVVQNLYIALKKITDIMRSDFVTVLDLEIPKVIEGDND